MLSAVWTDGPRRLKESVGIRSLDPEGTGSDVAGPSRDWFCCRGQLYAPIIETGTLRRSECG
jgi:hypothetical protein